jgi:hypothetical protein
MAENEYLNKVFKLYYDVSLFICTKSHDKIYILVLHLKSYN